MGIGDLYHPKRLLLDEGEVDELSELLTYLYQYGEQRGHWSARGDRRLDVCQDVEMAHEP